MKSPKEGNFCSIYWGGGVWGPCRSLIRVSQSGVRELGYLCHHTYQAMGEGCPLEARGPQNLLAPQCIGKGGSSSLRESGVQTLGRENTLEALFMKTAQGSEGMWAEAEHSRPQPHLQSPSLQAPLHTHHCRGPSQPNSSHLLLSPKSCLNYPCPPPAAEEIQSPQPAAQGFHILHPNSHPALYSPAY